MPLFGEKNDPAEDEAARAMYQWAMGVPPAELAAELMAAFGTDGPTGEGNLISELANWLLNRAGVSTGLSWDPRATRLSLALTSEMSRPVEEAVQLLEHAELICVTNRDAPCYRPTRLGMAILANGKAAVRQRIKDRTGL